MTIQKFWNVKFYQTKRGDIPVADFIEKQDQVLITKFDKLVHLLIDNGPFLKPPHSKKLFKNLYELRVTGRDPLRIFYTKGNDSYYLLHIFKKKTQKTPSKELKTAIDRAKDII
jgi:phage-related protein